MSDPYAISPNPVLRQALQDSLREQSVDQTPLVPKPRFPGLKPVANDQDIFSRADDALAYYAGPHITGDLDAVNHLVNPVFAAQDYSDLTSGISSDLGKGQWWSATKKAPYVPLAMLGMTAVPGAGAARDIGDVARGLRAVPVPDRAVRMISTPSHPVDYGFRSSVLEGAAAMKQAKGEATQMLGALRNSKGINNDELDFAVGPWLESQKGKSVTRDDIVKYANDHLMNWHYYQLPDSTPGEDLWSAQHGSHYDETNQSNYRNLLLGMDAAASKSGHQAEDSIVKMPTRVPDGWIIRRSDTGDYIDDRGDYSSAIAALPQLTYFHRTRYSLPEGADLTIQPNWRDLSQEQNAGRLERSFFERRQGQAGTDIAALASHRAELLRSGMPEDDPQHVAIQGWLHDMNEVEQQLHTALYDPNFPKKGNGKHFVYNSHFQQPDVQSFMNVHDRTALDEDGNQVGPYGNDTLHVTEGQSDWHQKGRKQAAVRMLDNNYVLDQKRDANDNYTTTVKAKDGQPFRDAKTGEMVTSIDGLSNEVEAARRVFGESAVSKEPYGSPDSNSTSPYNVIPDSPNKSRWVDQMAKHGLLQAARGNYDRFAFSPAGVVAQRWGAGNYLRRAAISPDGQTFHAVALDGREVSAPIDSPEAHQIQQLYPNYWAQMNDAREAKLRGDPSAPTVVAKDPLHERMGYNSHDEMVQGLAAAAESVRDNLYGPSDEGDVEWVVNGPDGEISRHRDEYRPTFGANGRTISGEEQAQDAMMEAAYDSFRSDWLPNNREEWLTPDITGPILHEPYRDAVTDYQDALSENNAMGDLFTGRYGSNRPPGEALADAHQAVNDALNGHSPEEVADLVNAYRSEKDLPLVTPEDVHAGNLTEADLAHALDTDHIDYGDLTGEQQQDIIETHHYGGHEDEFSYEPSTRYEYDGREYDSYDEAEAAYEDDLHSQTLSEFLNGNSSRRAPIDISPDEIHDLLLHGGLEDWEINGLENRGIGWLEGEMGTKRSNTPPPPDMRAWVDAPADAVDAGKFAPYDRDYVQALKNAINKPTPGKSSSLADLGAKLEKRYFDYGGQLGKRSAWTVVLTPEARARLKEGLYFGIGGTGLGTALFQQHLEDQKAEEDRRKRGS